MRSCIFSAFYCIRRLKLESSNGLRDRPAPMPASVMTASKCDVSISVKETTVPCPILSLYRVAEDAMPSAYKML